MDYKDYLNRSKSQLEGTLDRLRRKNEDVLSTFGFTRDRQDYSKTVPDKGIILTDSVFLADGYGCGKADVRSVIEDYIAKREAAGFKWYLLDLADTEGDSTWSWMEVVAVLDVFNKQNRIGSPGNPVPLFIIGNDDVIPMPRIENPTPQVVGGEYLDADYRYAFESGGDENDYSPFMGEPTFLVGRFPAPLAEGVEIRELSEYLERCRKLEEDGGMNIGNASMVSTETWIPSSRDMVSDIPIVKVDSDSGLSVEGKLVLSPNLDLEEDELFDVFSGIEKKTDYLVFNLHGSDDPSAASYYGEDINRSYYPEGFRPALLEQNAPRVLIATACYGARFIGYDCDDSMLLSALYNGTLLFVGSCVTALGNPDGAGFSEYLVKLLNVYLHQGMPAGVALSKAKEVYYRDKTEVEGCEYTLFTNLEFNLFGNPMLAMKPVLPEDYVPKGTKDILGRTSIPTFKAEEYKVHSQRAKKSGGDILSQVRAEVDHGLDRIVQTIQEELYDRLGLQGTELDSVIEYGSPGKDRGYYFTFNRPCGKFLSKTIAKTDLYGNIRSVMETK